jgi:alpha-tubulin suppressor-like RCC1 family protein
MVVALTLAFGVAGASATSFHAMSWGVSELGELGNGTTESGHVAGAVTESGEVTAISAGGQFGLALLKNGKVEGWGYNASGELGNGTTTETNVPVAAASGLSEVAAISAGGYHSLVLLKNGTVRAFGLNAYGELGNESTTTSNVPVTVKGLSEVAAISAGGYHSLALLKNGTVMAWGNNQYGQLGDGNTTNTTVPVKVTGLIEVAAIATNEWQSLALLKNGTVKAWGVNSLGELGDGNTTSSDVPVAVSNLAEVTAISAGGQFGLALLKNGKVEGWGYNASGELGNGTTTETNVPVAAASGLSEVAAISAGGYHSLVLLKNGTVRAFGFNAYGELGNESTTTSNVPVTVKGLSEVAAISAGPYFSLATRATVGTPPANTAAPTTSNEGGNWLEGQQVAATKGSWTGTEPLSYVYQWEKCNAGGASCVNIAGAAGSAFVPDSSEVGDTLRVIVTATNTAGAVRGTSSPTPVIGAQTAPVAHVLNSAGQIVQSYGETYAGNPGGQIQRAENFAECGVATGCSSPPATPAYPKVSLEAGTFPVTIPYTTCQAVFAYSGVQLQGAGPTTKLRNEVTFSTGCSLNTFVLFAGANPTEPATWGSTLNIASLLVEAGPAGYGLQASRISGPGLSVAGVTVTGTTQAAMRIGSEFYPVDGTSGSPVTVANNAVQNATNEGIVLEGQHMNVASNSMTNIGAHGIAVFGPSSEYVSIHNNTITSSSWGVSLDGSESETSIGRFNSVESNTINETCVGTILYRQIDDTVAGNWVTNPSTTWKPHWQNQGCPEFGATIGLAILNSCDNGAWSNRWFYVENGVWIFDGGRSPSGCESRTTANYLGRVLEIGQPWPWPVAGNWIEHPLYGFRVTSYHSRPAYVSGNEFVGNAIDNYSLGMWLFESGASEITSENT